MRAICCMAYGEPKDLVLAELPEPTPTAGQVLVAVEAVGLGYVDALQVRGGYQLRSPLPFIPGSEIVGRVVALGDGVSPDLVGRRIMALTIGGGLAERACLPAAACMPVPAAMRPEEAASFLLSYATALYGLSDCGQLGPEETVLVLGAAGGVGLAAIDVAKAIGARVIAAASSPGKLAACTAQGADATVDYSQADWRRQVQAAAGERGIDVVYDPVGGAYSETALRCLAPGGRLLVVGFASGEIPRIPLNLPLLKRCSIVGVDFGGFRLAHADGLAAVLGRLADMLTQGRIAPAPTSIHPLEDAPDILQRFLDRSSVGKPVIRL